MSKRSMTPAKRIISALVATTLLASPMPGLAVNFGGGLTGGGGTVVEQVIDVAPGVERLAIPNVPLGAAGASVIKPNLMFVLDDSGSMNLEFMPGEPGEVKNRSVGLYSNACNTLYFDPAATYAVPPSPDRLNLESPQFDISRWGGSVPRDGFAAALAGQAMVSAQGNWFRLSDMEDPTARNRTEPIMAQSPFYYRWLGSVPPTKAECREPILSATGTLTSSTNKWERVDVPSAAQDQFRIWYAFYRSRLLAMKSAAGLAFSLVDDGMRVGLVSVNPMSGSAVSGTKYQPVDDFDFDQKKAWLRKLYLMKAEDANQTPLREALSRAGRHFAGIQSDMNAGMTGDPVQHWCQPNYALMTTDGYWNGPTGVGLKGPYDVIEQKDGPPAAASTPRPQNDTHKVKVWLQSAKNTDIWENHGQQTGAVCTPSAADPNVSVDGVRIYRGRDNLYPLRDPMCLSAAPGDYVLWKKNTSLGWSGWFEPQGYIDPDTKKPPRFSIYGSVANQILDELNLSALKEPGKTSQDKADWVCTPAVIGYTFRDASGQQGCWSSTRIDPPFVGSYGPPTTVVDGKEATWNTPYSLADVAKYYADVRLRDPAAGGKATNEDVKRNVAPRAPTKEIPNPKYGMTTYTMGFGVDGHLKYDGNYEQQTSGEFTDLVNAKDGKGWLGRFIPEGEDGPSKVDDLWHAGINGGGKYFSAKNADDVVDALAEALADISGRQAAGAGVGVSATEPGAGNNFAYAPRYWFGRWFGDVAKYEINVTNGQVTDTGVLASTELLKKVQASSDSRRIYLAKEGLSGGNGLLEFKWDDMASRQITRPSGGRVSLQSIFRSSSVFPSMRRRDGSTPADADLVNYLRGQWSQERTRTAGFFRSRDLADPLADASKGTPPRKRQLIGDIIGSQPTFAGEPYFNYAFDDYPAFKAANGRVLSGSQVTGWKRTPVVYVGANDGMLHAFRADTLEELWAIIPSGVWPDADTPAVKPGFARLASTSYNLSHRWSVDGKPYVADVFDGNAWRTILVGGYNAGGVGYYALDVTRPEEPKLLWELNNDDRFSNGRDAMGLSYGNPIITRQYGTNRWVVVMSSGYNTPDGDGTLVVVDAVTGQILKEQRIAAPNVGGIKQQVGLAKISAYTDNPLTDNTARYVYGGDLLGRLWRFDISEAGGAPTLLGTFREPGGSRAQAVTSQPEVIRGRALGDIVVIVATGRLLTTDDVEADTPPKQSVYAIVDRPDNAGFAPPGTTPARSVLNQCTLSETSAGRDVSCGTTNTAGGWFIDLPAVAERVSLIPRVQLGTLIFGSVVPNPDLCLGGGKTYFHQLNYLTGGTAGAAVGTSGAAAVRLDSLVVDYTLYQTAEGVKLNLQQQDGAQVVVPLNPGVAAGSGKRISWREVMQ